MSSDLARAHPGVRMNGLNKIMHNAGVVDNCDGRCFYKGEYINKSPWEADFSSIDPNNNTYNYVQAILYAKEMRAKL